MTSGPGDERGTTATAAADAEAARSGLPTPARIALAGIAIIAVVLLARETGQYIPAVASWVQGLGFWGPLAFIVVYALAVVAFVPGALLTLAGGAIFGIAWGTLWVFIAAVLGSSLAFLTARYLARGWVEERIGRNERFAAVDRAIGQQGFKIMFLLRLSPAFPFSFMNFAVGLTRISFRDYVLASVGMLPGTLLYVYSGKVAGDVAALSAGAGPERGAGYYAVVGAGLLATLVVTILVTRIARRALAEATGETGGSAAAGQA